ncbi:MAG TPA: class I SAM-dependent methyltransferase [Bacteroidales bacterium]|nr:class I SAM-dependent methyltransferase [Bacteroidales bacterium]
MKLRPLFKGLFTIFRSHYFIPGNGLVFVGQMARLSKWIHKHKKQAGYSDFYDIHFRYNKREDLFKYLIETEKIDAVDYIEFGVAEGCSFKWWVANNLNSDSRFVGFDTFTGLPEDWGPFKKGDMSANNKPPKIDDNRHQFIQGLFQQTLPGFLTSFEFKNRKVIHMDADLYTATLYVLTSIAPYLNKGDIIMFDEFNVPMHEFKAFTEFVNSYYIDFEVLGAVNNFYQIAVKIK